MTGLSCEARGRKGPSGTMCGTPGSLRGRCDGQCAEALERKRPPDCALSGEPFFCGAPRAPEDRGGAHSSRPKPSERDRVSPRGGSGTMTRRASLLALWHRGSRKAGALDRTWEEKVPDPIGERRRRAEPGLSFAVVQCRVVAERANNHLRALLRSFGGSGGWADRRSPLAVCLLLEGSRPQLLSNDRWLCR